MNLSDEHYLLGDSDSLSQDDSTYSYSSGMTSSQGRLVTECTDVMTLSWKDVTVYAPPEETSWWKKNKDVEPIPREKPIISKSSGIVHPGSLVAIIGASGSGKTVLLNMLTHRNMAGLRMEGDIRVNGQNLGKEIAQMSAYVQQRDAFLGTLKVKEHLMFQAQLRLGNGMTDEDRERRVEEVMAELGLTKRADTLIGIPGHLKTLSGGERKRLLFASEILTNPSILFCDEPTTGLDSFMAQSVIQMLKNMAAKGRTILCTIHQPASEVYAMFDQLLLLADGKTTWLGPTRDVLPFFDSVGYACPPNYNPADFFIHTLAKVPGKEAEHYKTVERLSTNFDKSVFMEDIKKEIDTVTQQYALLASTDHLKNAYEDGNQQSAQESDTPKYRRGWWTQFSWVFWRSWLTQIRDPVAIKSAIIQNVFVALFLGLIYLQQDYDQEGVQNIDGAMFMIQMLVAFNTMFAVLSVFPNEFPLYVREFQDGLYRIDAYYLAHALAELPIYGFILPIVYNTITYWMIGLLPEFNAYMIANAVMILLALYGIGVAHMVIMATWSMQLSLTILPLVRNVLSLFGGFFINIASIPYILVPLEVLACLFYSNEIMVINQWLPVKELDCDAGDSSGNGTDAGRCLQTGEQVIQMFNFHDNRMAVDFAMLVLLYVMFESVGMLLLWRRSRKFK